MTKWWGEYITDRSKGQVQAGKERAAAKVKSLGGRLVKLSVISAYSVGTGPVHRVDAEYEVSA